VAITVVTPAFKDVQWLADHPTGDGMVVSCYAGTSVTSGARPLWREHLKSEVKRIDETLADAPAARAEFHRNITEIEAVLSSRRLASARGVAVFAASERSLLQTYALASSVQHRLFVNEEPYLVPLLELLHRQRRYLVVHTNTHRGRLYTAVPVLEDVKRRLMERHHIAIGPPSMRYEPGASARLGQLMHRNRYSYTRCSASARRSRRPRPHPAEPKWKTRFHLRGGVLMAIHKVIEVLSQSEKSWEDATQRAVADAGKTVENIKSIWVKNFEAVVKDNKIVEYRVNANITFEVKE